MKTNKFLLTIPLLLLGVLLLAGMVDAKMQCAAAPTLTTPATSGKYSGTLWLNVSSLNRTCDITNCSVYCSSSLTANSSASLVGVATNKTVAANQANVSIWTGIVEDANNYVCYARCSNYSLYGLKTETSNSASRTSIIVDNGVPSRPVINKPADGTVFEVQDFYINATVNNSGTTSCYFYWGAQGGSKQTVLGTYSGTECKTQLTGVSKGYYEWDVKAYDGTNLSSPMVSSTFQVDTGRSTGAVAAMVQQINQNGQATITSGLPKGTNNKTLLIGGLLILGVWYFFVRKK